MGITDERGLWEGYQEVELEEGPGAPCVWGKTEPAAVLLVVVVEVADGFPAWGSVC